ncbi:MAG: hypothetical protein AB1Z57_10275, partial [Acidimicrobiia bacterium]
MTEPTGEETGAQTGSPRWVAPLVALVAVGAAIAGWLVAPDDWPAGDGTAMLTFRGDVVAEGPVSFGSPEPARIDGDGFAVDFPGGLSLDGEIADRLSNANGRGHLRDMVYGA